MNLEERLRERICREGPISFYEWMKAALYDETDGYYSTHGVRQGRAGDYRTAPETSPLFAATFASYFAKLFAELGSPDHFTVMEFGGGSGEFARGVLTTLQAEYPRVFSATSYLIEEAGEGSRAQCVERLSTFLDRAVVRRPSVSEGRLGRVALAEGRASVAVTGIVFSNELIDAFPVNRVVGRDGGLRELYVGLNQEKFVWVEGEPTKSVANYCDRIGLKLTEGQTFEVNPDADAFIARAAKLLDRGYIVTVDYGAPRNELLSYPDRSDGTLRAFRRHRLAEDVLAAPGKQDLTTTIDWTQLTEAGYRAGLKTVRFEQLDKFLIGEGLLDRLTTFSTEVVDAAEAARLTTSARELILPTGMAASFQVLVQEKLSALQ